MIVYRLSKQKFARDLSGRGAETSGGRWNSRGVPMLYTSESRALCVAEIAVHTPLGIVPEDYVLVSIEIPEVEMAEVAVGSLPPDWKVFPHARSTQTIGDRFILDGEHLVLKVPSAVVQGDYNYLVNPLHPDFPRVKVIKTEAFSFDTRLFR
jgi:RES domain-containing protein